MTHKDLVKRAAVWLKRKKSCRVVMAEHKHSMSIEIPDVIGWDMRGMSYVVECKTSASDFRADSHKMFRRFADRGMGVRRYFFAEMGVLDGLSIPDKWGLLEIWNRKVWVRREAKPQKRAAAEEMRHLIRCIRACREWKFSDPQMMQYLVDEERDMGIDGNRFVLEVPA